MTLEGIVQLNKNLKEEMTQAQELVEKLKSEIENIKKEREKINENYDIALINKRKELKRARENLAEVVSKEKKAVKESGENKFGFNEKKISKGVDNSSGSQRSSLGFHRSEQENRGKRIEPKPNLDWYDKKSD